MPQSKACSAINTRKIGGEMSKKVNICQDRRGWLIGIVLTIS